jgi:hypothetical protein
MGLLLLGIRAHPLSSVLFVKWIDRLVDSGLIYCGKILLDWLIVVSVFQVRADNLIYPIS